MKNDGWLNKKYRPATSKPIWPAMILQYRWGLKPSQHCFCKLWTMSLADCPQDHINTTIWFCAFLSMGCWLSLWIAMCSTELGDILDNDCRMPRTRGVPATLEISYFPSKSQFTTNFCQSPYLFILTSQAHQLANILPTLLYTETNSANWLIFDQEKLRPSSWFTSTHPHLGRWT